MKWILLLALIAGWPDPLLCAGEDSKGAMVYSSSLAGERLAAHGPVEFTEIGSKTCDFVVDDELIHQTITGFGASFMEAGMICLNSLPDEKREGVLRALFDQNDGAGFSLMKTPVAGTDFMSAGPWYSYNDVPGDVAMKHFSIARDLGPSGVATYIRKARRHGGFLLAATMDYPPDWMLFDVEKNQNIDPRYFGALAGYYLRYLREYEKAGIRIDYLSPFNEPGVYTKIPWDDIRDLIKGHVGPLFAREGVKTRLMLPESCDRRNARDNHPLVLDDPEARRFISVMPYHGYNEADFKAISSLRSRYPQIPLWMTEVCHGYIVRTPREFKLPNDDFADGDHWGNMIFSDMEAGASAWVYWNMILDEKGGPWLVSPVHGNPAENVQQPLVIVNRESGEIAYTGGYWYLSHFSRFVRPGSVRVSSSGSRSGVRCLVFKKPGGGFVAQFLNSNREAASVSLACRRKVLHLKLPAVSISTCVW